MTRRARQNKTPGRRGSTNPPQIRSNIVLSHIYRYVSSSGTPTAVTSASIFGALGTICTVANTTVTSWTGSFRIAAVELWGPPASQGAASTVSCEWNIGVAQGGTQEVSDTTCSVAVNAHVHTTPPRNSLASFWQTPTTQTMFTLTAPSGTIIDLHVSAIMFDEESTGPTPITVTTATLGQTYYLSLDPNATHRYTPISLATTT